MTILLEWDLVALHRKDIERRKSLFRIMDAMDGIRTPESVKADLDCLRDSPVVREIRAAINGR
jgi:hypothetical protein